MSDQLIRCLLGERPVRVVALTSTGVAREAARRHGAVAGAQVALARATAGGLLLATMAKDRAHVTLQILGDGPWGGVVVDANREGQVRAYIKHPEVLVPGGPGERVRLVAGVGRRGVVNVVRDLGLKERVQGQAPLLSGEIDADIEHYLTTSEQIESAMGCDAVLDHDGIATAGGVLVQCMPDDGRNRGMVGEMWRRVRLDAVYDTLAAHPEISAEGLAREVLGEFGDELRVLASQPVRFQCGCSRERVVETLALLPADDLETMIREDGGAEVTCEFCREIYRVDLAELQRLKDAATRRASN
jgi:molecular chaperone Hsp33